MRTALLALAFVFVGICCGSGDESSEDPISGEPSVAPDQHKLPADGGASSVPVDQSPNDVSNCKCGIGCYMALSPDGSGYYCKQVCVVCP